MSGVGGSERRGGSDLWTPRPEPPARAEPGKSPLSPGRALLLLPERGFLGGLRPCWVLRPSINLG